MNAGRLQILNTSLLKPFKNNFSRRISASLRKLDIKDTPLTKDVFAFYTSISSVFSSKIEGVDIDYNSYIRHRFMKVKYKADYTKKTDDLFNAYKFARKNQLKEKNILKVHSILAKNILQVSKQGKVRNLPMIILDDNQRIAYSAAEPGVVEQEFEKLMNDITYLTQTKLSKAEVFYFASMLHLCFVKIHPMFDGNGRTSRLIEKWFLATHLGDTAWNITSEKYYYSFLNEYYKALNVTGATYENSKYSKAGPFLKMLVNSLPV
jgi:Fic family protein